CECGKTTVLTNKRESWFDPDEILKELGIKIQRTEKIDYITFSGSGEPTLSKDIGYIISKIKSEYKIPVCVLTNGNLLYLNEVRDDLLNADLVLPSLDAVSQDIFNKINRPVKSLSKKKIIEGLIEFRKVFNGKIFLEILFVKNINDTESEIKKISNVADKIKPDKIQLNTCVRPGTETDIQPLTELELKQIALSFNFPIEIISSFKKDSKISLNKEDIITLIKRRPCSINDISLLTSIPSLQIVKMMDLMKFNGIAIKEKNIKSEKYFFIEGNNE
ncbi:MAG TPA: radical SAM protein, partial [bacterium]|nr:radical SAM protein [bacterium]